MSKNNSKNTENDELSIKDTASKLDISEATVKKYLRDFDLQLEKGQSNKTFISQNTFQALTEIVKLRSNGLSIQEIRELKTQEPSKNILDEVEETQRSQKEEQASLDVNILDEREKISSVESLDKEIEYDKTEEQKLQEEQSELESIEGEVVEGRKRRGFNYRYVERQISNDAKRVSTLRQRLKNPNLSVHDRLFFEEALERRILFLNGWKHILRWISTR